MKVVRENHSQMTLRLEPWSLHSFFFLIIIILGSLHIVSVPTEETFSCRRDTTALATCQLSSKSLSWSKPNYNVLPLKDIQGTKIDIIDHDDEGDDYRLVLLTNYGEIYAITTGIGNQETVKNWGEQIEVFLNDTQKQNLLIKYDNRIKIYIMAVLFPLSGLTMIALFSGGKFVCKIDKSLGKLTLSKSLSKSISPSTSQEYSTFDIRAVTVETTQFDDESATGYRVALVMHSGEYIPISPYYSMQLVEPQETADRMSKFLKLKPLKVMSVTEKISTLQDIPRLVSMNQEEREAKLTYLKQVILNNRHDAEVNYLYGFALSTLQRYHESQYFLAEAKRLFGLEGKKQRVQEIDSLLKSINRKL